MNSEFNVQSRSNWRNSDFSHIDKKYIGVTNHNFVESLSFLTNGVSSHFDLKVKLAYTLLDRKRYKDEKIISIDIDKYRKNLRTCNHQMSYQYEVVEGMMLRSNPFNGEAYIWFSKEFE